VGLAATDPQRFGAFYRDMLDLGIVRERRRVWLLST